VKLLQSVSQQLEGGKYAEAAPHFKAPAGANAAQIESALKGVVEKREISSTGVDILAKDGKWGKLAEVFGAERASGWAERNGVSVDQCYGLGLDPAEVGFYWDGSQLLIIRLDDVGKLADR
jgi:hypothetical protein